MAMVYQRQCLATYAAVPPLDDLSQDRAHLVVNNAANATLDDKQRRLSKLVLSNSPAPAPHHSAAQTAAAAHPTPQRQKPGQTSVPAVQLPAHPATATPGLSGKHKHRLHAHRPRTTHHHPRLAHRRPTPPTCDDAPITPPPRDGRTPTVLHQRPPHI